MRPNQLASIASNLKSPCCEDLRCEKGKETKPRGGSAVRVKSRVGVVDRVRRWGVPKELLFGAVERHDRVLLHYGTVLGKGMELGYWWVRREACVSGRFVVFRQRSRMGVSSAPRSCTGRHVHHGTR